MCLKENERERGGRHRERERLRHRQTRERERERENGRRSDHLVLWPMLFICLKTNIFLFFEFLDFFTSKKTTETGVEVAALICYELLILVGVFKS